MEFSYRWLQEYFEDELPKPGALAESLGLHAFELEGITELPNGDTLIDIDILPNRSSDCYCYAGIAKEISAITELELKDIVPAFLGSDDIDTNEVVSLEVVDTALVPRATKRLAQNVTVAESPEWLKTKLESIGQKTINNVVDISNYVMWVTGQPIHIFDYDKLAGEKKNISIGFAKNGEVITDLARETHELDEKVLVIADGDRSLDIAGIKGGADSGVDENTKTVLVSACNFDFENIRNTSRKLKLRTDASARFENDVPLNKIDWAHALAGQLLVDLCGAKVSEAMADTNPDIPSPSSVSLTLEKCNSLLGLHLTAEEVSGILSRLDLDHEHTDGVFTILPPIERPDLAIAEDVIEEVGRIYGLENIPLTMLEEGYPVPPVNALRDSMERVVDTMVDQGFYEVHLRALTKKGAVELLNPFTSEMGALRTNLLDELLLKAEKNLAHTEEPRVFEIGKVFTGVEKGEVQEHFSFAGVIGRRKIKDKQKEELFYQVKGILENVFDAISVSGIVWEPAEADGHVAKLLAGGESIGVVGVNYFEINFEKLITLIDLSVTYRKPSKYPKIARDVAVFVPDDTTVKEVEDLIKAKLPEEATDMVLFDVFKKPEDKKKSLAWRITFQSWEDTLSDAFANEVMDTIYTTLADKGYEIR